MDRLKTWMESGNGQLVVAGIMLMLAILTAIELTHCGGSNSNPPIYSDSGQCLANCPDTNVLDNGTDNGGNDLCPTCPKDINGDNIGGDQSIDQTEVEPYVCPSEIPPPEQYEACMPKAAKDAYCKPTTKLCKHGFFEGLPCTSDSFCQSVPPSQWPPCVCWQFCGYAGEWECGSELLNYIMEKNDDGTCKLWPPPYTGSALYLDPLNYNEEEILKKIDCERP